MEDSLPQSTSFRTQRRRRWTTTKSKCHERRVSFCGSRYCTAYSATTNWRQAFESSVLLSLCRGWFCVEVVLSLADAVPKRCRSSVSRARVLRHPNKRNRTGLPQKISKPPAKLLQEPWRGRARTCVVYFPTSDAFETFDPLSPLSPPLPLIAASSVTCGWMGNLTVR